MQDFKIMSLSLTSRVVLVEEFFFNQPVMVQTFSQKFFHAIVDV